MNYKRTSRWGASGPLLRPATPRLRWRQFKRLLVAPSYIGLLPSGRLMLFRPPKRLGQP